MSAPFCLKIPFIKAGWEYPRQIEVFQQWEKTENGDAHVNYLFSVLANNRTGTYVLEVTKTRNLGGIPYLEHYDPFHAIHTFDTLDELTVELDCINADPAVWIANERVLMELET